MAAETEKVTGEFARFVHGARTEDARVQRGVDLVVELVDGRDHAGVTMASRDRVWGAATTDQVVADGDALQYELGEGPCLDAVRFQHTVISHDLAGDRRWPRWGLRMVSEYGVHGMLSLLLYTDQDTIGALNLYADRTDPWTSDAIAVAHVLADQLAVAVADGREIDHRGKAMAGRTVIGQAQGILMERFGIDADQAFAYLRRVSQDTNRKLVDLAQDLVANRCLPSDDQRNTRAGRRTAGGAEAR
jgi:hypothetical protein